MYFFPTIDYFSTMRLLYGFMQALRELVFGTATGPSFNTEWRRQNFEFCNIPKLAYGLVQHKVKS